MSIAGHVSRAMLSRYSHGWKRSGALSMRLRRASDWIDLRCDTKKKESVLWFLNRASLFLWKFVCEFTGQLVYVRCFTK